jgi:MFS family permease
MVSFFGLNEYSTQTRSLIRNYVIVTTVYYIATSLSSTFLLLFLIDELGYKQASIIITVRIISQMIIDYPSGSLGDWIGQKWVLIIAGIFNCITFYFLFLADAFIEYLIGFITLGIARAQESGAFSSWLDNNYKLMETIADPDRKNFGFTKSRLYTLLVFTLGLAYAIGGSLSSLTSRRFVFLLQIILTMISIGFFYILIDDKRRITEHSQQFTQNREAESFTATLKAGMKFLVSGKIPFFFIMGYSMFLAAWTLWVSLFLWPISFGYTGSDAKLSSIFSIGFFVGGSIEIIMANISKKVSNKNFPRLILLHNFIYFSFIVLLLISPPKDEFNLMIYLLLIFFELLFNRTIWPIALTIYNRVVLDLVPSNIRNSIYSLIPTIVNLMAIPFLMILGTLIETYSLTLGLLLVLFFALFATLFLFIAFHFMQKQTSELEKSKLDTIQPVPS